MQRNKKLNYQTIAKLFNDWMSILWPNGVKHINVLLVFSDAAPYMAKPGKAFYLSITHYFIQN